MFNNNLSIIGSVIQSITGQLDDTIPGKADLLFYFKDGATDSIGLSVDDYALLSAYWQGVFFTDPTHPVFHTHAEWMAILLVNAKINQDMVFATTVRGFAVYRSDTSSATLLRVGRYFDVLNPYLFQNDTYFTFQDGSPIYFN